MSLSWQPSDAVCAQFERNANTSTFTVTLPDPDPLFPVWFNQNLYEIELEKNKLPTFELLK